MSSSITDVTMPQMGVSVAEGTVIGWSKQPGDWVEADETVLEVSTDKIDTEVPAPASGRLAEILVQEGETVDVGTVLARIETDARPGEAHASETREPPPAARPEPAPAPATNGARRYSPVVQRIAAEHGIDLAGIAGTGRGGRVRKQDVLAAIEGAAPPVSAVEGAPPPAAAPEPPLHIESPYRPDPEPAGEPARAAAAEPSGTLSRMRRTIGEHMKRSLDTAATCTTWIEVDFSGVEAERARLGLTALPVVARATVDALREHPALNATLDGEDYRRHDDAVHLGIAVSLGDDGLIVPVIRDAQDLSAEGLGRAIREVARRARARRLDPDEVRGGTFTITNPGQFGSIMATPVINQPQVGILDVEAVVKRPVVIDVPPTPAIAVRPICILGLSWDHRALDGVVAAQFLATVKRRLEALREG
ncbi:dihydrolipoamide acetyltransferase family protein [Capillimicrobium parvum]|uniref:Dihydrolipoamide acetyltransferase component of pyruvate dehydrogenase complex n=1 Tax=Capillimicrobium parvum TaxID=2884022 RepID=A0A9E7BX00_9ACTN|nr:dihydrolipoamide acetyltransferase family protein [Capillimicrobium parvum]UGS33930.1 Dihydrolipoyllysine-residue acetyltransferase component of pyruvate dehydrogenase complex [Capillimicrobium parvum]